VLIAVYLGALRGASTPRPMPAPVASFTQAASLSSDLQGPAADKKLKNDKKEKKDRAAKPAQQERKPKKKKVAKESEPSPDAPVDPEADAAGRGLEFSWKQHPSMRYGDVFRLDVEAKLQEGTRPTAW
jgi:hypothetical protein